MNTFDLAVCSLPGNRCRKRRSLAADLGKQFVDFDFGDCQSLLLCTTLCL